MNFNNLIKQKKLLETRVDMRLNPDKYTIDEAIKNEKELNLINNELWNDEQIA